MLTEEGMGLEKVRALLSGFDSKDIRFSSGRIFGSMCTSPHPLALEAHIRFHESNLGNPGLCPGTAAMEREVVSMLGSLLHLKDPYGHILSGATEANITAMYLQKMRSVRKKVLFPRSAHFSVLKAVKLLDLVPVPVDLDERFRMSLSDLREKLDEDVLLILCVAGTTELGAVDPIEEVSRAAGGIPVHVDAAFGGYVLPFLERMGMLAPSTGKWDFSIDDVSSMCVDPHKMGRSTVPAGCLLMRDKDQFGRISVDSPYLTSQKAHTLAGTRDSGSVAGAFAVMKHLGAEGYCTIVRDCMENTSYLIEALEGLGLRKVMEPVMNIAAFHHPAPEAVQRRMEGQGYYISRIADPPALRFVVMPHVTREAIDSMVPVLKRSLKGN
ncbi:MAG: tyrosine decarboxylase MfnA [Candidatus Thermoplasmatota archaeon]|jgi:tyrosine decarboxylase/aspartate 1-decarboxylase|nr:tyrosine decarboxylase MfnA [Candidatus Thermoplasmatota archaeon]